MNQEEQAELNEKLFDAAKNGNNEEVRELIEAGGQVNTVDIFGRTPLHYAAGDGHTETVKALIEAEAQVNAVNRFGRTILHLAAENGHTKTVKTLVAAGADVNANDSDVYGYKPLHKAAQRGYTTIAEELIAAKADVNAKNIYGNTPLHEAAENGHIKIVERLIAAEAGVNVANQEEQTPLDNAQTRGYEFYNKVIDAIAKRIKSDTEKAKALMMGSHTKLGATFGLNDIEKELLRIIIKKADIITLADMPEKHQDAVEAKLNELQGKHVDSHATKVAAGRNNDHSQARS